MLLTLVAEANGWDKTAAIAAVVGTAVVLVTVGAGLVRHLRAGHHEIFMPKAPEIAVDSSGYKVTATIDIFSGNYVQVGCDFRQGRFVYPAPFVKKDNHMFIGNRSIYSFHLPHTFAPPVGPADVCFRVKVTPGPSRRFRFKGSITPPV